MNPFRSSIDRGHRAAGTWCLPDPDLQREAGEEESTQQIVSTGVVTRATTRAATRAVVRQAELAHSKCLLSVPPTSADASCLGSHGPCPQEQPGGSGLRRSVRIRERAQDRERDLLSPKHQAMTEAHPLSPRSREPARCQPFARPVVPRRNVGRKEEPSHSREVAHCAYNTKLQCGTVYSRRSDYPFSRARPPRPPPPPQDLIPISSDGELPDTDIDAEDVEEEASQCDRATEDGRTGSERPADTEYDESSSEQHDDNNDSDYCPDGESEFHQHDDEEDVDNKGCEHDSQADEDSDEAPLVPPGHRPRPSAIQTKKPKGQMRKPSLNCKTVRKLYLEQRRQQAKTPAKGSLGKHHQRVETSQVVNSDSQSDIPDDGQTLVFGACLRMEDGFRPEVHLPCDECNTPQRRQNAGAVVIWLHDQMQEPHAHVRTATYNLGRRHRRRAKAREDEKEESSEDSDACAQKQRACPRELPPSHDDFHDDFDFGAALQHVHWVLPAAPQIAVNAKLRPQLAEEDADKAHRFWYSIDSLDVRLDSAQHMPEHAESSLMQIQELLNKVHQSGIGWDRIVLGGFGQGAAIAAAAALRCPRRLGGVVMQNGWLPQWALASAAVEANRPPFLVINGDIDSVVCPEVQDHALAWLREHGFPIVHIKAWFLNHCDAVLMRKRVLQFLCEVVPRSRCSQIQTVANAMQRSCVFPVPEELSRYVQQFDLDKFSQVRGLV